MKKLILIFTVLLITVSYGQSTTSVFDNVDPDKGYNVRILEPGETNFPELTFNSAPGSNTIRKSGGKPYYSFNVNVYDGTGSEYDLVMGIDTFATRGIDPEYGEEVIQGLPQEGQFDARLYLPDGISTSLVDYREGDDIVTQTVTYRLKWQLGENSLGIGMIFNIPKIGGTVDVDIMDKFGGEYLYENFKVGIAGVEIINPDIDELIIVANYVASLPVELTSFTANVTGDKVKLVWQTATEINNSGFNIEKSSDNVTFEKIGFVEGNGTTTEIHSYSFIDNSLPYAKNFYRLKQIDYDGSYEYSDVVEVDFNPTAFSLGQNYPNPFNPSTNIKFALPVESKVTITMYNMLGQKVQEVVNGVMNAGLQEVVLNAGELSSGMYLYNITALGTDGSAFTATKKMMLMK